MRIFVESVLRFGVPPHFAAFILSPRRVRPRPCARHWRTFLRDREAALYRTRSSLRRQRLTARSIFRTCPCPSCLSRAKDTSSAVIVCLPVSESASCPSAKWVPKALTNGWMTRRLQRSVGQEPQEGARECAQTVFDDHDAVLWALREP